MSDERTFETDVVQRLRGALKTARMWGSPEELEGVACHFSHVLLGARTAGWTWAQTEGLWRELGGPFALDAEEHRVVRERLWGSNVDLAREQVVSGFACVWAALGRRADREARLGPWLETLLDRPTTVPSPDVLDAVLFALMGFVASDANRYVELLSSERRRIGGHGLRPLHLVGPSGASGAGHTWTRRFESWDRVTQGVEGFLARLPS